MGERCAEKARATPNIAANASAATTGQPSPSVIAPETGSPPLTQHRVRGMGRETEHRKRIEASMIALADRQTLLPWGQRPSTKPKRQRRRPT